MVPKSNRRTGRKGVRASIGARKSRNGDGAKGTQGGGYVTEGRSESKPAGEPPVRFGGRGAEPNRSSLPPRLWLIGDPCAFASLHLCVLLFHPFALANYLAGILVPRCQKHMGPGCGPDTGGKMRALAVRCGFRLASAGATALQRSVCEYKPWQGGGHWPAGFPRL
jgi:hypothetical protein